MITYGFVFRNYIQNRGGIYQRRPVAEVRNNNKNKSEADNKNKGTRITTSLKNKNKNQEQVVAWRKKAGMRDRRVL